MCLLCENIASSFVEVWHGMGPNDIYWIIANVSCSFYQGFFARKLYENGENKGLITTSAPSPIYKGFFSRRPSTPTAKVKLTRDEGASGGGGRGLRFKKATYSICHLRVSIIFEAAMATRHFEIILYCEHFISSPAWFCYNFRLFFTF